MRTAPDRSRKRGKGLAWALAVLGALLIITATALPALEDLIDVSEGRAHTTGSPDPRDSSPRPTDPTATPAARPAKPAHAAHAAHAVGRPLQLAIPEIGVAAPVTPIEPRGSALVPPDDPDLLGWWRSGGRPGAVTGTTVIAGHTVHTGGGVFDDLADADRGALVRVRTPDGVLDYRVRSVTTYSKASLANHAQQLFSQTVPGRLALVTCEDWNGIAYESNTVVLATPAWLPPGRP